MPTSNEEIGDRVRRLRKAAGQTQEEFAETTGISLRSLKGYETGARELPTSAIMRLCELSSVTPSWILMGRRDELDEETIELLERAAMSGLDLLREHLPSASSKTWSEYLGILMKLSYAQGTPLAAADAQKILTLRLQNDQR